MTRDQQLSELSAACRALGAEVRYCTEQGFFTAMLWEEDGLDETQAVSIQQEIRRITARYPGLVCYCFDPYSTLVYTVGRQDRQTESEEEQYETDAYVCRAG